MAPWGAAVPLVPELRFGAAGLGRRRISRPPDASVSRGGGVWERLRCGCRWHRECCGWCAAMRAAAWLWAARAVPCCSAALGLRALGCFVDAGWQDLRTMHDSRGPCSEKRPFLARSSRGVFPNGCLRGISDAWRAYLAKASPFSDAWRANLAANWRFSRPRPLLGCMERKTCHGLPPGNAPRRNLVTARPPRTHRARRLPLPVRPRAHQGAIPPPSDAGKRISRAFCHRRAPGNASRHNLATTGRPRRTPRAPMCYGSRLAHGRGSERLPRLPTPPDISTPLDCGCCRRFGRWRWHNPLIVALLPSGS